MGPLHSRSHYWIRKGVFNALTSFQDFEERVNAIPEEKDRGDVFEIFIEGYLATQNITQRVRHWVVGRIPLQLREQHNLPRDTTGIDGVYETHSGSLVAYQVKYRRGGQLSFGEVAPFLGITEKFEERVIFTNATRLSHKAVARTRWVGGDVFHELTETALHAIEAWINAKRVRVERRTPDPRYQVQALADIKAAFKKNDRATVVMACGTGKTLVALWAVEEQKPKTVLVLLPSLTLLQQTLREWSEQTSWGDRFTFIGVCSDKTVAGDDAAVTDLTEIEFPVRTDPKIVRQFLQRKTQGVKVIFSTYQSSPIVGKGARGLPPFDIAILDEAHKTTGLSGSAFGFALSDKNIRVRKRLFLTATPRHIDIRKRNKEGDFRVLSMDDEHIYGTRAYTLSFSGAAKLGIICRYKVIISLIDKEMVSDFTRKNGITLVKTDEVSARWMANLIAIHRAIDTVAAKKVITFHSRVKLAREFATDEPRGIAHHLIDFDVRHVNGTQNSADRADTIRAFASSERGLLTNARCLTEGVNIPAVDMVAFVDPRQSRIDIAQAVGRAMRKPRGPSDKTVGYVVVPLFAGMGRNDSLDEAVKSEKFKAVADVLNALQEHDEDLTTIIREIKQRKGEGYPFNPKVIAKKVEVIGPTVSLERLTNSIGVEIADCLGTTWDEMFGRLVAFSKQFGTPSVPQTYFDRKLAKWTQHQRSFARNNMLRSDRLKLLQSIGFQFDPYNEKWWSNFERLRRFSEINGDANIASRDPDRQLARWVVKQRVAFREGRLEKWKIREFEHIKFEFERDGWDRRNKQFLNHAQASRRVRKLGVKTLTDFFDWARGGRDHDFGAFPTNLPRSPQQVYKGEGWKGWNHFLGTNSRSVTVESTFDNMLSAYVSYLRREEPGGFITPPSKDKRLRNWITTQRMALRSGELSDERKRKLQSVGFDWDPENTRWEEGLSHLKEFFRNHNHGTNRQSYRTADGFLLGAWIHRQRQAYSKLSAERKQKLKEAGFVLLAERE
jgi:superfamily II DNA or RNA helicase